MFTRRMAIGLIAATSLAVVPVMAQDVPDYPTRPITLVVPFAPGGATDISARLFADQLGKELNQSVVVENRAGAAGNIGMSYAASAAPDGYVLMYATMGTLTTNPHIYDTDYDVATAFIPISKTYEVDHVLVVRKSLGIDNLQDLIAKAKEEPGRMTFGSSGIGSSVQMFTVMLDMMAGTQMQQVPYGGSAEARVDVVAGNIDMVMDAVPSSLPQIESGDLVPIAVTGAERNPSLPDVPTMAEAGLEGYAAVNWGGLLAPAGTPQAIIDKLSAASEAAISNPDLVEQYNANGMKAVYTTPAEMAELISAETEQWGEIVDQAGISVK